jgi:hypothetical protein
MEAQEIQLLKIILIQSLRTFSNGSQNYIFYHYVIILSFINKFSTTQRARPSGGLEKGNMHEPPS